MCPASANGVVALKPTVGLVSRSGIIPIASAFDTAGPMARTVKDCALVLAALQGVDARDEATAAAAEHAKRDYAAALRPDALRGARIGVARPLFGFHPGVDGVMADALGALAKQGAELVDPVDLSFPRQLNDEILEVMFFELKAGLNAYLRELEPGASLDSLSDIIAFNETHAAEVMPHFGQGLLVEAQKRGALDDAGYKSALERVRRAARDEGIDRVVKEHRLDAIVAPSGSPAWLTDHILGDHFIGGSSTPAAMAGYPNVSLPVGSVSGLPVGMSMFGPAWSEPRLLSLASALEQATHARHAPQLETTAS
jgi:amidase